MVVLKYAIRCSLGLDKVVDHVQDALALGATCVFGGSPPSDSGEGGYYFQPTILVNITKGMKVYKVKLA